MLNDTTLTNTTHNTGLSLLTSSAEVIHASRTVMPGSERASAITASAGLLCLASSKQTGPLGLLTKMLLAQSVTWYSTKRLLIWKKSATPANRTLYRLLPVEPSIEGIEFSLLPTPMYKDGESYYVLTLEASSKRVFKTTHWGHKAILFYNLKKAWLNPHFSLWMMGYPITYLDLEPQAIQSTLAFQ